jgi:hypothetical protein
MVIALVSLAVAAILAAARASALIGRDGHVHYIAPNVRRASSERKKFERRLHLHR